MSIVRSAALVPAILWFAGLSDSLRAQSLPPQEVKSRILASWDGLLSTVQTVSWESVCEAKSAKAGEDLRLNRTDHFRFTFKRNQGFLFLNDYKRPDDAQRRDMTSYSLFISNGRYSAELRRPKPDQDDWLLKKLEVNTPPVDHLDRFFPWMILGNLWFHSCLADPCLVVTKAEQSPERSEVSSLLRVHFSCDRSKGKPSSALEFLQSGFVDIDTSHSHRPTRFEYQTSNPKVTITQSGSFEYESGDGIPVIRSATVNEKGTSTLKGVIIGTEATTYNNVEYDKPVNDTEFWLTHYRLPEPIGVQPPKSIPNYVWLVVAAVVFAAIAALFRWLARRPSQLTPSPAKL